MRIGIDARELCGNPTGVGRHLAGLLGAWSTNGTADRHQFFLYAPRLPAWHVPGNANVHVLPGRGGTLWEQVTLAGAANRDQLDVFFAPGYTAPLRVGAPVVVLVHDLSFLVHPEWFRPVEGMRRRLFTRLAARRAQRVLAVSESARAEIVDRLALPPQRVRCIYPGISRLPFHGSTGKREPLVLFVGSIFNRRHLPDLIEAFKILWTRHREVRMEIVGDNRTHPHQALASIVAAEGLQDVVTIRSYIADSALAELYGRAGAFAFLSDYEGFGHPPLEALASGIPPVLLDSAVARETCLDAAIYVRNNADAIASALDSLLFDEQTRRQILSAAPSVLARYSWANAAEQTLGVLQEVGSAHG